MIQHVVMFRWNDGVDDAHVAATTAALTRLPGLIPEIAAYSCGRDLAIAAPNFDFAVSARFQTVEDYVTYRDHPEHQAVVQSLIVPFVAVRAAVQFEEC